VTLYRCFAWNDRAKPDEPDGPCWNPRAFQGDGRHDNPETYGCLYLSEAPLSCVVEQFAPFRGQALTPSMLQRRRLPLALAALDLDDDTQLVDLDDPAVLRRERLRASLVATRQRELTQAQARRVHGSHPASAGLRWWSMFESTWMNVTLFDRAAAQLRVAGIQRLSVDDETVAAAAAWLGL